MKLLNTLKSENLYYKHFHNLHGTTAFSEHNNTDLFKYTYHLIITFCQTLARVSVTLENNDETFSEDIHLFNFVNPFI